MGCSCVQEGAAFTHQLPPEQAASDGHGRAPRWPRSEQRGSPAGDLLHAGAPWPAIPCHAHHASGLAASFRPSVLLLALGRRRTAERGARLLRLAGQPGRAAPAAHALLRVRARGHVRAHVLVLLRSGLAAWPWPDACSRAGQVVRALLRVRQGAGRAPAGAGRAAPGGARGREPRGPAGRGRVAGRGVRGPGRPAAGAGRGCAQQPLLASTQVAAVHTELTWFEDLSAA